MTYLANHPVLMVTVIVVGVAAALIGAIGLLAIAVWGREWPDGSERGWSDHRRALDALRPADRPRVLR